MHYALLCIITYKKVNRYSETGVLDALRFGLDSLLSLEVWNRSVPFLYCIVLETKRESEREITREILICSVCSDNERARARVTWTERKE